MESSGVSTKASEDGDKPNPTVCRSLRADCTQSCDNIVGLHEQEQVVGLGEEMRCVSAPGDLYTVPTPPHNSVVQESIAGEVGIARKLMWEDCVCLPVCVSVCLSVCCTIFS